MWRFGIYRVKLDEKQNKNNAFIISADDSQITVRMILQGGKHDRQISISNTKNKIDWVKNECIIIQSINIIFKFLKTSLERKVAPDQWFLHH